MNGMFSRGLVYVCISLAAPVAARAQGEAPKKTEEEAHEAAVTRAAEVAQLKAVVDELQVKLRQARDEVQQALSQRDGQEQIADLRKQLQAARVEAERDRDEDEEEAERDRDEDEEEAERDRDEDEEEAERDRDEDEEEAERERDEDEEETERERDEDEAEDEREREEERAERDRDEDEEEAESERDEERTEQDRDEGQRALEQRNAQKQIAELREQLQAARKGAEREESGNAGGIHRAIGELRGEVRQLREEVQGLRKLLESRPAANQGAQRPLQREDLCHIRSRVAGEIVRIGAIEGDDREGRSIRAGDIVRKGQVLAVVCCDQISEKEYDLIEAITKQSVDERILEDFRVAYNKGALTPREMSEATRTVEVDRAAVHKLERTLRAWHVDEVDLVAIREHAQQHRADDDEADAEEQSLPWGQVKVLAPVDGVVLERNVSEGELVQLDAKLFLLQEAESAGNTPK